MKQNNINRAICWLMALALAMLPTLAQGSRQVITTPNGKQYILSSSQPDIKWEQKGDIWRPIRQIPQKTESTEGTVTVTIESVVGEMENVYLDNIQFLDAQSNNIFTYNNTQAVAPGTFDIMASYSSYDTDNMVDLYYFVFKENVMIAGDTTITFDVTEATRRIKVSDHHPNGELFTAHENYGAVDIESGLCRKNDRGHLYMIPSIVFAGNFPRTYINQVSERFSYYQGNRYVSEDWGANPEAFITFYVSEDLTQPLENNADDYRLITEKFTPSKLSQDDAESKGIGCGLRIMFDEKLLIDARLMGISTANLSICDVNLYVNIPDVKSDFSGIYALVYPAMVDFPEIIGYFPWGEPMYYNRTISAPSLAINQDDITYLNLGMGNIESLFLNDEQEVKYPYGRGPHPFYLSQSQKKQDFGSSVPIFLTPGSFRQIIGRYGEIRDVDLQVAANLTLYKNGEEVWTGQMMNYGQNEFLNQEPLGIIDAVYDNHNVLVDDLQGQNLTTVHYDESLEDDLAPTITMLWFKSSDDKATDRFGNASDGILEFSAGDFIFNENPETYNTWLTCQPMNEVEVSYSPYQEDAWSELAVEEVPENFCSPGYGYFYRGSLAGVTGEALKGWFDLKVKLTDAAGNWQEQIVSPAFRIDDLAYTSVASIGSDNAHEVARYSIDGKRVDANHRGVTIVKMSDGTARKILVK